jgi:hypothetical protein
MPFLTSMIAPALIGVLVAFLAMFGLVQSQTAGPDQNPAEQAALVYGE